MKAIGSVTYAEIKQRNADIEERLTRISYRLRQGAVSDDRAAELLREIAAELEGGF